MGFLAYKGYKWDVRDFGVPRHTVTGNLPAILTNSECQDVATF